MKHAQLIRLMSERLGRNKQETARIFDVVVCAQIAGLVERGEVKLNDFGKFRVLQRDAYWGNNPRTQRLIWIPKRQQVMFKAGKSLREEIGGS